MRIATITLSILFSTFLLGQTPHTTETTGQQNGFSTLEIIRTIRKKLKLEHSSPIIFRRIEPNNDTIHIGKKVIHLSSYHVFDRSDTVDYFILLNLKSDTITFGLQDESLITIKEALNEKGKWMPIEHWIFSDCGNSYFPLHRLVKAQFAIIKTRKHKGGHSSLQRLRLKTWVDGPVIISDPYEGSADISEFTFEPHPSVHTGYFLQFISYLEK